MTEWTQQDLMRLIAGRPDISVEDESIRPHPLEEQAELELGGTELFYRLTDHREKVLLETVVQANYFKWVRLNKLYHEELRSCFAVPNGGKRPKKTAITMKAEGLEAGVPDLMCLHPSRGYSGLVIETKTKYNRPSEEQIDWLNRLSNNGFYCVAAWSTEDMINVTCWFYNLPDETKHRWPIS